ncbi:XrtA/PEP-CTERM system histidine kinase PrsK [Pelotalea chapellei]|uniref:histidine kinase n=1 Tax=Pelotalea chapellei TaxID=44671 RepID=A0ABS5U3Q2_9BACT|nr:XrtA/PEP-CTERM system histidine kinase PrsK [Pelotalea chapellei]MBT1070285.1 PEP-CTERM system histidine kinase PrsK [Pelotalea chapellei]
MLLNVVPLIAVLALFTIAVLVFLRDRSLACAYLGTALLVTALIELFDLFALGLVPGGMVWKNWSLLGEALLPPAWLLASLTYARQQGPWRIGKLLWCGISLTCLFLVAIFSLPLNEFIYAPDFPQEQLLFLNTPGFYFYIGITICLVIALVNLETTLANASPEALWKVKFDVIGLGTMLAVQVFYYSQALLYRTLNMNFTLLRSCLFILAAAMIWYSHIFRRGKVRIQVSRQTAYKSVVLLAVGGYLVMIGALGEGMKYFGVHFPSTVAITFAFLGGIVILVLLLSERVRREVKVVLHKNFYQNKYDYRTEWLRFTEQLSSSSSGEQLLQRILSAYCEIFGISGAAMFLKDENQGGYCMAAACEMEPIHDVILPENSLIKFMEERAWVVSVKEKNPEIMAENSAFFDANTISMVIPLFDGELVEGFIVLGKVIKPDETFIYEDYDLMKTIARQASLAILHQRLSEQITQAREVEAIGKVATFVVHDLKNLASNISLIVENASRHLHNPDFQQDMLASLGNTASKMQSLIAHLKNLGERELLNLQTVDLLEMVKRTATMLGKAEIDIVGVSVQCRVDEAEIQKVVMNLLINGFEASGTEERLQVEIGRKGMPFLKITDHGCGMSPQFIRTELFKPFSTTKQQGLGIGLYQCRQIIEAHNGKIEVSSLEGQGSVFTVWLPGVNEIE